VFGRDACTGNGLAVVLDGEDLTTAQMQRFAAWTQLAETTFLTKPSDPNADYAVRIFTVSGELPFAGHPTLGSCAAWLYAGNKPKHEGTVVQECGVGLVEVSTSGDMPAFAAPPTKISPMDESARRAIAGHFGIPEDDIVGTAMLDNGPKWSALQLASESALTGLNLATPPAVEPLPSSLPRAIGFVALGDSGAAIVRMVTTDRGYVEDPVTGSLNAALAHWLDQLGLLADRLLVSQGRQVGRDGLVTIQRDGDRVLIGGQTHILIDGFVTI
jgi:PhzF family phenazine biosynthesis protein